ncbi:UNVERIFIED_CONTAM: hypothetical protein HDU68_004527 [Siphonaria sp. JEL0065]|nr:hypothetical protein HDU68_004527 [Siphonaria sp. JEL0065]
MSTTEPDLHEPPHGIPPNKLLPLLINAFNDPLSDFHIFQRDTDAFGLVLKAICKHNFHDWIDAGVHDHYDHSYVSYRHKPFSKGMIVFPEQISFPPPLQDANGDPKPFQVNMMPFKMMDPDPGLDSDVLYSLADYNADIIANALPKDCKRYAPIIAACLRRCKREWGKTGYLTIHESYVEEGECQRRPGLHIESSGGAVVGGPPIKAHAYHRWYCWGGGRSGNFEEGSLDFRGKVNVEGGIFIASNLDDTCKVWDCMIKDHGNVTYPLGDIEHMRDALDVTETGKKLKGNQLAWITDRTPHESLPQPTAGFRQFFRLVTSELSLWYSEHSTPNEVGTLPACDIVAGNKFE